MKNENITNHSELVFRIKELRTQKLSQEIELKHSIKEFIHKINPTSMIKDSIHELSRDKEVRFDLAKVGLNVGANFIIDKVFGRNNSIAGSLSSMLLEKISGTVINKNSAFIIAGLGKLLSSKSK